MLFVLTLSRQIKITFVCFFAIKHLQGVLAFVILCGIKDFYPDFLHTAVSLCPGFLVNPLLPAGETAQR